MTTIVCCLAFSWIDFVFSPKLANILSALRTYIPLHMSDRVGFEFPKRITSKVTQTNDLHLITCVTTPISTLIRLLQMSQTILWQNVQLLQESVSSPTNGSACSWCQACNKFKQNKSNYNIINWIKANKNELKSTNCNLV